MKKPELVILAAGMGSRYGGLKQIDAVDGQGHIIIDYSIFDAIEAGFDTVTFIIKKQIEKEFREIMDAHLEGKGVNVKYVYQELDKLPEGYEVPEGRSKPWGTGHAIACCLGVVDAPFAVINADDYYGKGAFAKIYDFLANESSDKSYAMVGYKLKNTVTDKGGVSRGICNTNEGGELVSINETSGIETDGKDIFKETEKGKTMLDPEAIVSMNLWGFPASFVSECYARFPKFLRDNLSQNPEKCEYYMPSVITELLTEGKISVTVLDCPDKWYGVTYKEDKPDVVNAFAELIAKGEYPKEF